VVAKEEAAAASPASEEALVLRDPALRGM